MTSPNRIVTYLKDYKKPAFRVENIYLTFDIEDDKTLVTNEMSLTCLSEGEPLRLNGEELKLTSISLDGRLLKDSEFKITDEYLEIASVGKRAHIIIETEINPSQNKALSGLYRSDGLFCTQCEAEGFRRITYYFDRPDVLSTYTTKIIADKQNCPVLLSNGNLIEQGELSRGKHFAIWQDPFKKPSYLFALVAGNLAVVSDQFITQSGRKVDLKMYVEHGNEGKCEHAINALKAAMKWDEERYGREYDLDIYMIVAVSTFNMGAMENKGLNIFNDKYVLARPELATDADYAGIEGVIAHEYFHNWTGNRITCRDWFQLSLKEGLTVFRDQTFSADMNSKTVCRIKDVDVLRTHQFPEDNGPTAHAVQPDSYIEINNFYTTTIYNKGAEVIRMQRTLLGEEGFRRGTDLYFDRYDGQAVTIEEFVGSMEEANRVDLSQFRRWYTQAGTPIVNVTEEFANGTLTLRFTQRCNKTPGQDIKEPFHIPIRYALFDANDQEMLSDKPLIELKRSEEVVEFTDLKDAPRVSLLREFSAPIILERDLSLDYLIDLAHLETDGFAKCEAVKLVAKSQIIALQQDRSYEVPKEVLSLYRSFLEDDVHDFALKALLLTTPSFEYLVAGQSEIDVQAVIDAMKRWELRLAECLESPFIQWYGILASETTGEISGEQAGIRALKNQCLHYLTRTDKGLMLARKQQSLAQTMTDEIGAFMCLCERPNQYFNEARDAFYEKWQEESLVLDKWFGVLASADCDNIVDEITSLTRHKKFSADNPNKVRALLGAFMRRNLKQFHKVDGSGYQFIANWVKEIDPKNPQLASFLVQELTLWKRYDQTRQALMKKELEGLKGLVGLSKDVYEKVSKALSVK